MFNVLSDYSIRHIWAVGLKGSDQLNSKISKNGSTHRCVINNNKNDPFFTAHDFNATKDYVVFTETDSKKGISVVYSLTRLGDNLTEMKSSTFLKSGIIKKTIFSVFLKKKFLKDAENSAKNLEHHCKEILAKRQSLTSKILLAD